MYIAISDFVKKHMNFKAYFSYEKSDSRESNPYQSNQKDSNITFLSSLMWWQLCNKIVTVL